MSSKLFDIYTNYLNSVFDKISRILDTLPSLSNEKFYFSYNELEINFKECEKKFQQMDFELNTVRSPIQKEIIAKSITNSKETYENYKIKASAIKDSFTKQSIPQQHPKLNNKSNPQTLSSPYNHNHSSIENYKTNEDNLSSFMNKLNSKSHEDHKPSQDTINRESYCLVVDETVGLSNQKIIINEDTEDNDDHNKDKYSKGKLSKLYQVQLHLIKLYQSYPKLIGYSSIVLIVFILIMILILYSHYVYDMANTNTRMILMPDEVLKKANNSINNI